MQHTVFVCTTCKKEAPDEVDLRAGERFFQAIQKAVEASPLSFPLNVVPQECLSGCKRACTIALTHPCKFSYVFGDLSPHLMTDILCLFEAYACANDGIVRKKDRPESLKNKVLGRIPPLKGLP